MPVMRPSSAWQRLLPQLAAPLLCAAACAATPASETVLEPAPSPAASSPPPAVVAPADAQALRRMCSEREFSQAALKDCLEAELRISETALTESEAALAAAIAAWDEDPGYRAAAETARAAAAAAFAVQREAECAFAQSLAGGAAGNTRQVMALSCAAALNTQRAARLRTEAAGLPAR
jgi:Lysozyme inhibitor LprI